jgi:hypothetical protein
VTQDVAIHSGPAAGVMRSRCQWALVFRRAAKNSRWHHWISIGEDDTSEGLEQSTFEVE